MKKFLIFCGIFFVVLLFGAVKSYGENLIKPNSGEISFFVGPLIGDTSKEVFFGTPVDVGLDDSVTFGGRAAINFNSVIAFEGILELSPVDVLARSGGASATLDTFASFLHANVVVHVIQVGRFIPYVTGGFGFMHLSVDEPGVEDETDFAFNFGGGGKFFFTEKVGLRLEVRDVVTKLEDTNDHLNLVQITVGLSFLL